MKQPLFTGSAVAIVTPFKEGGVDLEADLVARNRLIHPGFVPVEPLEVLRG